MTFMTEQNLEDLLDVLKYMNGNVKDTGLRVSVEVYDHNSVPLGEVRLLPSDGYVFFPPEPDPNPF